VLYLAESSLQYYLFPLPICTTSPVYSETTSTGLSKNLPDLSALQSLINYLTLSLSALLDFNASTSVTVV